MVNVYIKKLVNDENLPLPHYASEGSAGMDIYAYVEEEVMMKPGDIKLIPTGYAVKIPEGYEIQIRPRSGLALKHGITVLNSPGTIDYDYTGEIKIILINLGKNDYVIKKYDRVAQMLLNKIEKIQFICTDVLPITERGNGGFGHTGI
ncbi:MAG: dUTP diphosphatase [Thermoanaerobacteraceae bacterium]|nr:dUTP diphosphatase [Thermoanaerobacteraceae bacterium]